MGHFEISLKNNKGINNMIQKLIESFDNDVFKYQSDSKQIEFFHLYKLRCHLSSLIFIYHYFIFQLYCKY